MLKAKSIVDNKFWILESEEGARVGTIKVDRDRIDVVVNGAKQSFEDMGQAINTLNLTFAKRNKDGKKTDKKNEVYEFPTSTEPHNALWNVQQRIPIYTKTVKSNSYHCAGYYIIRFATGWVKSFCPKLITLQRYDFRGPYKTKLEMQEQLRLANETA
jgi:hypothetical protein